MIAAIGPHEKLGDICEPTNPVPTDVWRRLFRLNENGKFVHQGWIKRVEYRKLSDIKKDLQKYLRKRNRQEGHDRPLDLEDITCAGNPSEDATWPEMRMACIACFVVTGGSESHFIHVEVLAANHRHHVFTAKTLGGIEYARKLAGWLADALGA